jgi:DNA-binding transcriptional ArsR family regulator
MVKFGPRSDSVSRERISAGANRRRERGLKTRRMAIAERRAAIVEELQQWSGQDALDLAELFQISRDTIDKDLNALEGDGLVVRERKGRRVIFRPATPRWR